MAMIDMVRAKIATLGNSEFTSFDFDELGNRSAVRTALTGLVIQGEIIISGMRRRPKQKSVNIYLTVCGPMRPTKTQLEAMEDEERSLPRVDMLPTVLGIRPDQIPKHAIRVHRC